METEGILNRKVDKVTQQPTHSQSDNPQPNTLMVNRKEGLFVEKPLHDGKKGSKKARFGERRGQRGRRKERRRRRQGWKERKGRRRRRPGTKKPDGRTRMVRSVRNSFRQGLPAYLPKSCFTSAAFQRALPPKRVTSLTVARSRLLAQQLFYFGGLRKIVAAEASVHHVPRQRDGPPTCPRAASLRQPPKNRCRRSIGASHPSAKRRTDYLPKSCFTSAATVTPL